MPGVSLRYARSRQSNSCEREGSHYNSRMQIPGYNIERELGHGGMATVYLAIQESLGRPVALKVMSPALVADRSFSERFLKEARTIAQLSHPHIVAVYDVGVVGHDHYLALEYVSAGDLKLRIRRGTFAPADAFRIIRDIASALGYAHSKGFVHRDVKPENILFRDNGTAVLTDFGIARAVSSGTRMTGMGMSIGTPHYMSPEQARGKDVDGRADLYALGIVLYEMLTGKVPYDAEETVAIGIMHVSEPVPVLPKALSGHQSLLDRLLAKNPTDRYRTAEALIDAIDQHDPNAKPRNSGTRAISQALSSSLQPKIARSAGAGAGLKWAAIGGLTAVTALGSVWMMQNTGKANQGAGGGGSIVSTSLKTAQTTDLEAVLAKPIPVPRVAEPVQEPAPVLVPAPEPAIPVKPPTLKADPQKVDSAKVELAAWEAAQSGGARSDYEKYLKKYPNGTFNILARNRLARLGDGGPSESQAWQLAEQANSREGYDLFLQAHPNSAYAALAKVRLSRLK
jgi:serine/threonine protein kinase